MRQYAEHDRIGIYHELRGDDMYVKTYSGGYPYLKEGVLVRSSNLVPIYSYGKNYEKNGKKFSMFVWTTNSDMSGVEKIFESSIATIDNEKIEQVLKEGSFIYLDS